MNSDEGRAFAGEMTYDPGRSEFRIKASKECDCGCGLPARVEFKAGGICIYFSQPATIDLMVEHLMVCRERLWGLK